jgi:transglutaminase-like putative cysteine protease
VTYIARNRAMRIIVQKQNQWTKGLRRKKSKIAIFEHVRDIPYAIVTGLGDPVQGPARMLVQNRGYCEPKHIVMFMMYQKLGIPVKYVSYPFRWSAQDIDYPRKLMKQADEMPMGYHLACKANINGGWILVDATWDLPLKKLGFPVNESWDGVSDTLNAVKPEQEIIHQNERERVEYIKKRRWTSLTEREKALSRRFFDELNEWLQEARDSR